MITQHADAINLYRWAIYFVFGIPFLAWLFFTKNNVLRVLATLLVLVLIQETFVARRYFWAVGVGPSNITAYVALVACLVRNGLPSGLNSVIAAWVAFLFSAFLGLLIGSLGTPYLIQNWLSFQNFYLEGFLWFLLGVAAFREDSEIHAFVVGLIALGGLEATIHLFCLSTGYTFPNYPLAMRLGSTGLEYGALFTNVNSMGNALVPMIPLALMYGLARNQSASVRLLSLSSLLVMLPSLVLTQARGPYLVTSLLVLLAFAWSRSGITRTTVVLVFGAVFVIVGLAAASIFFPDLFERAMARVEQKGIETPRPLIWAGYLRLIAANPFGVGLHELNVFPLIPVYGLYVELAHNIYLDLAARVGLEGLLAFLVIVGIVLWRNAQAMRALRGKQSKILAASFFLLVAAYLMGGFFEPIFQNSMKLTHMFFLYCGVSLAMSLRVVKASRRAARDPISLLDLAPERAGGALTHGVGER